MDTTTLSPFAEKYQRVADAKAFFDLQVHESYFGRVGALDALRARLSPAHFATLQQHRQKGAVDPSVLGDLGAPAAWHSAYLDQVRTQTALDLIGASPAPFHASVGVVTGSSTFDWIAEAAPAPVSEMTTTAVTLEPRQIGGIRVCSKEGLFTLPLLQAQTQRDSVRCAALATDRAAWDPARAEVVDVSPASLTYGATEIVASGTTGDDLLDDVRDVLNVVSAGRRVIVTNSRVATNYAAVRTSAGTFAFPNLTAAGGSIFGVPVITGSGVPDLLIAVDASGVFVADGGIEIEVSKQASLQMDTAPGSGAQNRVSLFQGDLLGLKTIRRLNWTRRSDAVAYRWTPISGSPM